MYGAHICVLRLSQQYFYISFLFYANVIYPVMEAQSKHILLFVYRLFGYSRTLFLIFGDLIQAEW